MKDHMDNDNDIDNNKEKEKGDERGKGVANDGGATARDDEIRGIIKYLNTRAFTSYRASAKQTKAKINARLNEGYTVDDFKKVIDTKVEEWQGTEFEKYLRPETLFGSKFENYLNQKPRVKKTGNAFADLLLEGV